jgi:hypothetical protein
MVIPLGHSCYGTSGSVLVARNPNRQSENARELTSARSFYPTYGSIIDFR